MVCLPKSVSLLGSRLGHIFYVGWRYSKRWSTACVDVTAGERDDEKHKQTGSPDNFCSKTLAGFLFK